jgi:chorismate mutase
MRNMKRALLLAVTPGRALQLRIMTKWLRYFLFCLILVGVSRQLMAQSGCFDVVASTKSHAANKTKASNAIAASGALSDLGNLIDSRLAVMQDVARYRWNSHVQIEDPDRGQKVLDSFKSQSEAIGCRLRGLYIFSANRWKLLSGAIPIFRSVAEATPGKICKHLGSRSNHPSTTG